ncbi:unnamed protein product [Psylliodes chrysocephalus]|uniref:Uncharacterized protein n=1 Tax=Psylliodes chrysocephalus TaxID=3402493 RepID=A0A9P0G3D4_9CUCU|nr:unnamed protein product [Psylliodes chrysocephala]
MVPRVLILTTFLNLFISNGLAINNKRFPSNFLFGSATSAYQVEGAWNADGKSESLWDRYIHTTPGFIEDGSTGDVACNSYYLWENDIAILKEMGANHYRFSIAWTRILPTGRNDVVNEKGITYYKNLIKALKQNNIEPMVSMFHWDTPQALEDLGGFLNDSIADWYADYARVLYENFGDDVKYWFTFNEPKTYCNGGYGYAYDPPRIASEGLLEYVCAHNLLRAHAKAYRIYDQEFRSKQNGKMSIVLDSSWFGPATNSSEDKVAAEQAFHFELGWYANPVHYGDYPEVMKTRIAARSAAEGRNQSRLPEFTEEEKEQLKDSTDFFAVNTYTGSLVSAIPEPGITDPPSRYGDMGVNSFQPDEWESTTFGWFKYAPWGMRILLNWIKSTYGDPEIVVTENGYPDYGGLNDTRRLDYHRDYLSYTRDAMDQDGVKVFAYTAWSLMDNFEWFSGYTQKFGLYAVDFDSENKTRTAKQSALYFRQVIKTKCLVDQCVE